MNPGNHGRAIHVDAHSLRQQCAGQPVSPVLALALARLEGLQSLLAAYESGRIFVMRMGSSMDSQREPEDPIRELTGRIVAAEDFIVNRLRDTPWSVLHKPRVDD